MDNLLINNIIILTPVCIAFGTLIWRLAKIAGKVDKNEYDINRIGQKVEKNIDKFENKFTELDAQVHNTITTITKIEVTVADYIRNRFSKSNDHND